MAQHRDPLEIQREYITQLLHQLTTEYPTLKSEMKQISEQYSSLEDEFTFLEELELLIVDISGYARQIQMTGSVRQFDSEIAHLHQLQVFANDEMAKFYLQSKGQYPKMQAYLQLLDYLRLVALEYLQIQQTMQPISA